MGFGNKWFWVVPQLYHSCFTLHNYLVQALSFSTSSGRTVGNRCTKPLRYDKLKLSFPLTLLKTGLYHLWAESKPFTWPWGSLTSLQPTFLTWIPAQCIKCQPNCVPDYATLTFLGSPAYCSPLHSVRSPNLHIIKLSSNPTSATPPLLHLVEI